MVAGRKARGRSDFIIFWVLSRFMIEKRKEDRHISIQLYKIATATNRNVWFAVQSQDTFNFS